MGFIFKDFEYGVIYFKIILFEQKIHEGKP